MSQTHILVVDDSDDILIFVRATLEAEGFSITTCSNVEDGFNKWLDASRSEAPFDLIITDLDMPKERGTVLAKAVRELDSQVGREKHAPIPIVLLTSISPEHIPELERADLMELDMSYLHKSAVSEKLVPLVKKVARIE